MVREKAYVNSALDPGNNAPNKGIIFRGEETFQIATENTAATLNESGRKNAASEIDEAIRDISRRPKPDITGAISHAMAAVECVSQDINRSYRHVISQ